MDYISVVFFATEKEDSYVKRYVECIEKTIFRRNQMMQINSISRQNELYTNSTESNGRNRTISDTPSSKEHIGVEYIKSEHRCNYFT